MSSRKESVLLSVTPRSVDSDKWTSSISCWEASKVMRAISCRRWCCQSRVRGMACKARRFRPACARSTLSRTETRNWKIETRNSKLDWRLAVFDFRISIFDFVAVFVADVASVLQAIDPAKAGLAALRGPVECWALLRAAASNAGVSLGD